MTQGKKILIVEDNALLGPVMQRAFARYGYDCRLAEEPASALELLKTYTPDIILSDYEMPGMNGFEFRLELLKNDTWKNIPFIFLTSHSEEELVLKGLNLSAIDYIIKGTPYAVISSKVQNILNSLDNEHKRSVEELRRAAELLPINSVPKTDPVIPGYKVRFWHRPFQNYPGGDFMDCIRTDDGQTFFLLGDIMGKKWEAWFFTFGYLSYIRSAIRLCIFDNKADVPDIMRKINKMVCRDENLKGILSSLSLLLLDERSGTITYTGAGDLPVLHYNAQTQNVAMVRSAGLLLGLQEEDFYDAQTIQLQAGDKLLAFTDGVTDIRVEGHKKSGFNQTVANFEGLLQYPQPYEHITKNLEENLAGELQVDDASLIFIEKEINRA